jgi:hypothetical protein
MAQAQGSSAKTYVGIERDAQLASGTWGSGTLLSGADGFFIPFKTNTIRKSVAQTLSQQITATRSPSAPARGNVDIGGDITAELDASSHGLLWYLATGNRAVLPVYLIATGAHSPAFVTGELINTDAGGTHARVVSAISGTGIYVTGITGGTFVENDVIVGETGGGGATVAAAATSAVNGYLHEFWISNALPSCIIEKQFTDIAQFFKYTGCMANNIKLTVSPSGYAELTCSFMGKDETTAQTAFYVSGSTNLVTVPSTTFDNFLVTVGEGANGTYSTLTALTEFSIEFNNNLDGSAVTIGGQGLRSGIAAGMPTVSGSMKAVFEDLTLYTKALNKTETGLRFTISNSAIPTGASGYERLRITMPEVYLTPNAPSIDGPGGVYMDMQYGAFYGNETTTGRTTAFHVELWNSVPDYTDGVA